MSLLDKILGRPLPTAAGKKEALSILTGVPALGLDTFASTAYGPEAALMILLPLGVAGLHYFFYIILFIVATLITLYLSYQQTAAAYPTGGGAYVVAGDNLGMNAGVWAAIALLLDYLLNVAVGISAGVGVIVSAILSLQHYTLILCLIVLLMLTILNLRGVRDSGTAFIIPTAAFVLCIGATIILGLIYSWHSGGHPQPVVAPPAPPVVSQTMSLWILLGAFANGLTAMTGIEAVSNAVSLFRKPTVKNAQWTLTITVGVLAIFLLSFGYLIPTYHIVAMNEIHPGYQTILSQLVAAVSGKGVFYYISIATIFVILTYSAQTSFIAFPRVCRLLAEDSYLPHFFAERGRRLVFSHGIILLALFSAIVLILFGGITLSLIPLFAVGAFTAFLLSQTGMVVHWLRKRKEPWAKVKLFFNGFGAIITAIALAIIIIAKFAEGAWIIVIIAPLLAFLFKKIKHHYQKISRVINKPLELKTAELKPPVVIIPIHGWNSVAEKAVRFGLLISDDVTSIYINPGKDPRQKIHMSAEELKKIWVENVEMPARSKHFAIPKLEVIESPYRRIYKPILDFVDKIKKEKKDRLIAVIIPELVEAHWYEYLLHNVHAAGLRASLFLERDQRTIVITTPWHFRER